MNREPIQRILNAYQKTWVAGMLRDPKWDEREEQRKYKEIMRFVTEDANCFSSSNYFGHITASALVTNADFSKVLLLHHKKLNKWLQLGGHADNDPHPESTAEREAYEESGLETLSFLDYWSPLGLQTMREPLPFDLDIHEIPERKTKPAHLHFDLRYLMVADEDAKLCKNHESNDLRWFTMSDAYEITTEISMKRQFDKLSFVAKAIAH